MISMVILYSSQKLDVNLYRRFHTHLADLERLGQINIWHNRMAEVVAGRDTNALIQENLQKADLILLLFSPDFKQEMWPVIERQIEQLKETERWHIIPVLLRPTNLEDTCLSATKPLPLEGTVTDLPSQKRDQVFLEMVKALKSIIEKIERDKSKMQLEKPGQQNTKSSSAPAAYPSVLIEPLPQDPNASSRSNESDIVSLSIKTSEVIMESIDPIRATELRSYLQNKLLLPFSLSELKNDPTKHAKLDRRLETLHSTLRETLERVFPSGWDEVRLINLPIEWIKVPYSDIYPVRLLNLIKYISSEGYLLEFIAAVYQYKPNNPELRMFIERSLRPLLDNF